MSNDNGERKLPTRAGWWWVLVSDGAPFCSRVWAQGMEGALIATDADGNHRLVSAWTCCDWLAPIPGPEVCAALAEYGVSLAMADSRMGGMSSPEIAGHFRASDALDDAIRAERDGAA